MNYLDELEAEGIQIIREAAAELPRIALLYSMGKDSSVLLWLARKAFAPARVPFPVLHIDTSYKFPEMVEFRQHYPQSLGLELLLYSNQEALSQGVNPFVLGTQRCCSLLKTKALLDGIRHYGFEAVFGGARREEERSRAKERIFSCRDAFGQWDPRKQRPEFWNLFNGRIEPGESMRVFPLSNWTELDVWGYIARENIPVVPLYFAKPRQVLMRGQSLLPVEYDIPLLPGEEVQTVRCRFRSIGCTYCSGAVRSEASTVTEIIAELEVTRRSEREYRLIDYDQDGSMEVKKRDGYF